MSTLAFNSQVGNGSDWHCLLGSECASSAISAGVVRAKTLNVQPVGQ